MPAPTVFNPLDKKNLGESIVQALLESPLTRINEVEAFKGAGVYAIYYFGNFPHYVTLAKRTNQHGEPPIYVGKATPQGGRKGSSLTSSLESEALHSRLKEHAKSIDSVEELKVADFWCRFIVVDDIWIPLAEALLIQRFNPLWNTVVEGFGNHDPGKGRYNGKRPLWDLLHPGRKWAKKCKPPRQSLDAVLSDVSRYMRGLS